MRIPCGKNTIDKKGGTFYFSLPLQRKPIEEIEPNTTTTTIEPNTTTTNRETMS